MKKILISALLFTSLTAFNVHAEIKSGPILDTLYPTGFFHDKGDGLYIEFQSGAMPECSAGRGGQLSKSNPNYKELYSLLLTMMATKNFKGRIRYKETETKGWWHCSIEGVFAFPK
ncbi:hypothetical protein [Vibrio sagamiensis]|uniref:hypothetical protein n=1 Tax=Vibrio sagamiensis TaxID=512650 RepID=UPI000587050F|nr:hypothetical protein [Vibrio sagamiensis]